MQTLNDNACHVYHQDEQGSTAYITGNAGVVENCYVYDVFGNMLERREAIDNRILYTGQQYDQETGQYYLRARFYNPVVGRFMQEDTYRGDGLNLYAYCGNNPVMYYDPSGHSMGDYETKPTDVPEKPKSADSSDNSKKVPNPHGKKGGQEHRDTIGSIQPTQKDGVMDYEKRFETPNGNKTCRYADAVEFSGDKVVAIHQVGKVNQNGTPVARESRAIADIMESTEYNGAPIYFWPYNSDMGPIIYEY